MADAGVWYYRCVGELVLVRAYIRSGNEKMLIIDHDIVSSVVFQ